MAEESILTDDFIRQLINVGEVDILVGLPTHNNAKTIGSVVQAIQAGILSSFPRERVAIINVDGGSRDGTPDFVTRISIDDSPRAAKLRTLRTLHSISTQHASNASGGTALRTILAAAELLRAKACAVISPESVNIESEWIPRLLGPIYRENFDLVTPLYRRHKFEGLLMSNLIYPMTRALSGWRIREPYAAEFGFSGRLGRDFLRDVWSDEVARSAPELHLTFAATTGGYRLCQAFLGDKARVEGRSSDLVPAIRQTVGALFWSLQSNFPAWGAGTDSRTTSTFGSGSAVTLEPVRVSRKRLHGLFRVGVAELEPILRSILSSSTLAELQRIAGMDEDDLRYPSELWVKTVYEFAASYHKSVMNRDHIIQALAPLFRGRMFSFLAENRNGSAEDVENNTENLCIEFERFRPYLLKLWNGGE